MEVPVEFDEGISKLLARMEVKRKARLEEHKRLLGKMEKEQQEEQQRAERRQQERSRIQVFTGVY